MYDVAVFIWLPKKGFQVNVYQHVLSSLMFLCLHYIKSSSHYSSGRNLNYSVNDHLSIVEDGHLQKIVLCIFLICT